MFLALMGEVTPDTFTVLIARPDTKYLGQSDSADPEVIEFFKHVNLGIDTIQAQLQQFFDTLHMPMKFVKVPMLAHPKKKKGTWGFPTHYSFINGVPFMRDGKPTFAYPDFVLSGPDRYKGLKYELARQDFEDILQQAGITPAKLTFSYESNSGFDCKSLVLRRKQ